jgi:hypothetical protein
MGLKRCELEKKKKQRRRRRRRKACNVGKEKELKVWRQNAGRKENHVRNNRTVREKNL